jgi:RNA polymerase sigma-70 factor (ECF subfamily)
MAESKPPEEGKFLDSSPSSQDALRASLEEQEKQLVQDVLKGDLKALEKVYEMYVDPVYGYAFRRTRSKTDAEELTSEIFTRAIKALAQGQYALQGKPFGAWLTGIARHTCQEWQRTHSKEATTIPFEDFSDDQHLGETQDALEILLKREEWDWLWQLILELPLIDQKILVLHSGYGLSHAEIARGLHTTESACKQRHYRALHALRMRAQQFKP